VSDDPLKEFGRRKMVLEAAPSPPVKRSRHVGLLLMGTVAVGGGAYALMPSENCAPNPPGMAAPGPGTACQPRSSSWGGGHGGYYGGSGARTSLFGGDAATTSPGGSTASGGSTSEAGHVSRGGFGALATAFSMHFGTGG
jgi:hypothetical protein